MAAPRAGSGQAYQPGILIYHLWYGSLSGVAELEPEVVEWLEGLPDDQFGRVEFYIDLLADRGAQLAEPTPDNYKGSYEN